MEFHSLTLDEYDLVYAYMSQFGEGSCQHSFVSMYSLFEKYGDSICEEEGFLYTLRSHMEDDQFRVYLAPMGNGDLKQAYDNIVSDAHKYNKKVKFLTLTEKHKNYLEQYYPGQFDITEDRNLSEYIYTMERMSTFPGKTFVRRRREVKTFWKTYEGRATVSPLTPEDVDDVLSFQRFWMGQNIETHDKDDLERECRSIEMQLSNLEKLNITGVVLRIDGQVHAYEYGTKLNDEFIDGLIEKGDKNIDGIYKVIRQEYCKLCAPSSMYLNVEEDLGIEGLRMMKTMYHPDFMIDKFIAREI